MKNIITLPVEKQEEKKKPEQKARIIKFPDINRLMEEKSASKKSNAAKLTTHYLYYKGRKIPITQFEKAGYGKLLRLLVKEISE